MGARLRGDYGLWDRGLVAVAAALNGFAQRSVTVRLLGGDLRIDWSEEDNCVYMTGPAAEVFQGELDMEMLRNQR